MFEIIHFQSATNRPIPQKMSDSEDASDVDRDESDWLAEEEHWPSVAEAIVRTVHPRDALERLSGDSYDVYWNVLRRAGFRALLNVAATSRMHRSIRSANRNDFHRALNLADNGPNLRRLACRMRACLFKAVAIGLGLRERRFLQIRTGQLPLQPRNPLHRRDKREREWITNFHQRQNRMPDWIDIFSATDWERLPAYDVEGDDVSVDVHEERMQRAADISRLYRATNGQSRSLSDACERW